MSRILDEKDARKFKKDCENFVKKYSGTKEEARQCLIRLGVYTKDGKLTKHYR